MDPATPKFARGDTVRYLYGSVDWTVTFVHPIGESINYVLKSTNTGNHRTAWENEIEARS